ncbi:hypothetical protein [Flocculibacter collagenilyticus]|uniref:hypothetical protein n=1 Tax=Flocculibacter collagenilyticus TaxID=2744479 RepID=UPI0018F46142|nr:hypothetical protein [Flocculibacter collagenilyticus]
MIKLIHTNMFCVFCALLCTVEVNAQLDINNGERVSNDFKQTNESLANNTQDEWNQNEWEHDDWADDWQATEPSTTQFLALGYGKRINTDSTRTEQDTLNEIRAGLAWQHINTALFNGVTFNAKVEGLYNGIEKQFQLDIRELNASLKLTSSIDLSVGRQVLTWGTGDYVFLNDLFKKDWQSFFNGRDDKYLKAANNAIKASFYSSWGNINAVWLPRYESDQGINGDYFSYYSPFAATNTNMHIFIEEPDKPEWAIRYYKNINRVDFALYGYSGFAKLPTYLQVVHSLSAKNAELTGYVHPLNTYGASAVLSLGSGIIKAEFAYHNYMRDTLGLEKSHLSDMSLPHDQFRWLVGYTFEPVASVNLGFQLYQEHNYATYSNSGEVHEPEFNRTWLTTMLNKAALQDRLKLSLTNFYSLSDKDHYTRLSGEYRVSDSLQITIGANIFGGQEKNTFFHQFKKGSNVYGRIHVYF